MRAKRLLLIGCGRQKAKKGDRAERLYTGSLTRSRIAYARRRGLPWLILSAKHGLLAPEVWIAPYNLTLPDLDADQYTKWQVQVVGQIVQMLCPCEPPSALTLEIHAGANYRDAITPLLRCLGFNVETPCTHLGIFKQLGFYRSLDCADTYSHSEAVREPTSPAKEENGKNKTAGL